MPKEITVVINGETIETKSGVSIAHLLASNPHVLKNVPEPLGAIVNNRLDGLYHHLHSSCVVKLVDYRHKLAQLMFRRTACLVLYAAMKEIHPEWDLQIGQSLEQGHFFYLKKRFDGAPCPPKDEAGLKELCRELEERMAEIIETDAAIHPAVVSREEAIDYFREENRPDKILLLELTSAPEVKWVILRGFRDLMHGPVLPRVGMIKNISLSPYPPGALLRFPTKDGRKPGRARSAAKLFNVYRETREWNELVGVWNIGLLNKHALSGKISDVIKIAEALHEKKIAAIADKITDKIKNCGGRLVTLIAGPSSSGKTTFSKRLAVQLMVNGLDPQALSLDNYYVNRVDTPKHPDGSYDFEHINALDLDLFNEHLNGLLNGEAVDTPVYDFVKGERSKETIPLKLNEGQALVIEGIHGLNETLTARVSAERKFKIYVSALTQLCIDDHNRIQTSDTRLIRRIVRDRKYRGYNAQKTLNVWPSVQLGEERWIFPFQEDADVIFNSALVYEPAVLSPYAVRYLLEVPASAPEYMDAFRLLKFMERFVPLFAEEAPPTSIIREFIGGSSFSY